MPFGAKANKVPLIKNQVIKTSRGNFNCLDGGQGPTVVFLHGWRLSKKTWAKVCRDLSRAGYRAIAIDLPGFGQSQLERAYNLDDYGEAVAEILKKMGIKKYTLVGHSFGAKVALQLAASNSNVQNLVLCSANFNLPSSKKSRFKRAMLTLGEVNVMKQTFDRTHSGINFRKLLLGVSAPVYIMHGRFDLLNPFSNAATLSQPPKKPQLIVFRHSGHLIYKTQRRYFIAQLKNIIG